MTITAPPLEGNDVLPVAPVAPVTQQGLRGPGCRDATGKR